MRKIAVLFLLLLAGCARETELGAGRAGADAVLNLTIPGTRASEAPFDENSIISARLIVYHSNSPSGAKKLVLNTTDFERVNDDRMSCRKIIPAGYINVYLIANEGAAGVDTALGVIGDSPTESQLEAIRLSYSNGPIDCKPKGITMFRAHKGLKIMPGSVIGGDGTITDADGTTITDLGQVERHAVKLDIGLICKYADATWTAGKPLTFKSATLKSVPNKPWLVAEKFYGLNDEDDDYFDVSVPEIINNSEADKVQAELTFIIPEHIVSNKDRRTYLEIECLWNGTTMTYELALGEGLTTKSNAVMKGDGTQLSDYNLLRNTIYEITATIKERGESGGENLDVYLLAKDWHPEPVNGDILNRKLNVSATEVTFTGPASARVYFWSNQPDVFIEPQGYVDDGTTTFTVNNFFKTLSGVGADNITYDDAAKSSGYFDLELSNSIAIGTYIRRIILNAGGLRREITVNATKPVQNYPAYDGVIGYNPATDKLTIDGTGVMVYFKFGSVVAMYSGRDIGDHKYWYGNSSVAFNPSVTDCTDYANVPYADGASTFPDHAPATGKGDPCKLIGLTLKEIKDGTKTDNEEWRLPTSGSGGFEDLGTSYSILVSQSGGNITEYIYEEDTPVNKGGYGSFGVIALKGDAVATYEGARLKLPFAGDRNYITGMVDNQGTDGSFWSGTPGNSDLSGYCMGLSSTFMLPGPRTFQSFGFPVRCVRQ